MLASASSLRGMLHDSEISLAYGLQTELGSGADHPLDDPAEGRELSLGQSAFQRQHLLEERDRRLDLVGVELQQGVGVAPRRR